MNCQAKNIACDECGTSFIPSREKAYRQRQGAKVSCSRECILAIKRKNRLGKPRIRGAGRVRKITCPPCANPSTREKMSDCRDCQSLYLRMSYAANRERYIGYAKRAYRKHFLKIKVRAAEQKKKNRGKIRETQRRWRLANIEVARNHSRLCWSKNKDKRNKERRDAREKDPVLHAAIKRQSRHKREFKNTELCRSAEFLYQLKKGVLNHGKQNSQQ